MATLDLRHLKHLRIDVYRVPESADVDVALFIKLFSFPRLETVIERSVHLRIGGCVAQIFNIREILSLGRMANSSQRDCQCPTLLASSQSFS